MWQFWLQLTGKVPVLLAVAKKANQNQAKGVRVVEGTNEVWEQCRRNAMQETVVSGYKGLGVDSWEANADSWNVNQKVGKTRCEQRSLNPNKLFYVCAGALSEQLGSEEGVF
jgi:hypothetical protein